MSMWAGFSFSHCLHTQHCLNTTHTRNKQQHNTTQPKTHLDDRHTTAQACNTLIELLPLILLLSLCCQVTDLLHTRFDFLLCGAVSLDDGGLLGDGDLRACLFVFVFVSV